ncbi:MAG: acyltransferase [Gammaproteobacteria bacterium]|nr:acyltransferase [Gammaproteobacteria bacterium]
MLKKVAIFPFKKVHLAIRSSAKVTGNGSLILGRKWRSEIFKPSQFIMDKRSQLILDGRFLVYTDCNIRVHPNATLRLGSGYINKNSNIQCYNSISIGHNVIISENVVIRDSDNHHVNGVLNQKPIIIKDNVWIGLNVTILNGVTINEGAIVAAGSVVISDVPAKTLVAGCPAKVKKENVDWE